MVKGVNEQNLLIGVLLVVALAIGVFLYRRGEEGYHGAKYEGGSGRQRCETAAGKVIKKYIPQWGDIYGDVTLDTFLKVMKGMHDSGVFVGNFQKQKGSYIEYFNKKLNYRGNLAAVELYTLTLVNLVCDLRK